MRYVDLGDLEHRWALCCSRSARPVTLPATVIATVLYISCDVLGHVALQAPATSLILPPRYDV